ncbi:MAG TPA: ATP phosphoribosyltransferase [Acidobacteriota bacterium]|nr:ATP phosphoribosyltransferase [Acidobacteriota bacterium]
MLTVALSKGRLLDKSVEFLSRAGIVVPEDVLASRRLIAADADGRYLFLLVKPTDLPTYVEYGVAAAGICGRDVLLEACPDLHQPLDLKFGCCRIVLAGKPGDTVANHNLLSTTRVATKYPRVAESFFRSRGLPAEVIYLSGSVELAPNLGLAETIVDLVETGRTLAENGLVVLEEIAESSARVVINRASFHIQYSEIQEFLGRLRLALS